MTTATQGCPKCGQKNTLQITPSIGEHCIACGKYIAWYMNGYTGGRQEPTNYSFFAADKERRTPSEIDRKNRLNDFITTVDKYRITWDKKPAREYVQIQLGISGSQARELEKISGIYLEGNEIKIEIKRLAEIKKERQQNRLRELVGINHKVSIGQISTHTGWGESIVIKLAKEIGHTFYNRGKANEGAGKRLKAEEKARRVKIMSEITRTDPEISKAEIAETYDIPLQVVGRWAMYNNHKFPHKPGLGDKNKLIELVGKKPDITMRELAKALNRTPHSVAHLATRNDVLIIDRDNYLFRTAVQRRREEAPRGEMPNPWKRQGHHTY